MRWLLSSAGPSPPQLPDVVTFRKASLCFLALPRLPKHAALGRCRASASAVSPSEAGLFAWGRKTCSDLCSRARCCKISALVQPSPAGSAACAQAPCIPSKACTRTPCVAGGKGGSPAARSLLLVALGGFRHFAGFSSRKIAVKKAEGRHGAFCCSGLHKELKKSVSLPRG